jgi:hypothetical protein
MDEKIVRIKSSFISLLMLIVSGAMGVGTLLAYTEKKYVSKETNEVQVDAIKHTLNDHGKKLDKIYDRLLKIPFEGDE